MYKFASVTLEEPLLSSIDAPLCASVRFLTFLTVEQMCLIPFSLIWGCMQSPHHYLSDRYENYQHIPTMLSFFLLIPALKSPPIFFLSLFFFIAGKAEDALVFSDTDQRWICPSDLDEAPCLYCLQTIEGPY